ncbi:MAG: hypothetical protein EOP53_02120 [Sphingobacteriales bacterium]|nr:MAG: hypothetical protein EOP53_02120 [Sphingobacteriales bacterium]
MNRRNYIKRTCFLAFCILVIGTLSGFVTDSNKPESMCITTRVNSAENYRPNAPFRNSLLTKDAPMIMKINVSGTVYTDCQTPLSNALVEVWQTDDYGEYDNNSAAYNYRASLKTDANGKYSFVTIIPGKFAHGDAYRASHINFRVSSKNHQEIVTQIFFKDDPYLQNDPTASQPDAAQRILPVMENNTGKQVVFNIYMAKVEL